MAALACFLSLVQTMSLAVKYSRAWANMINREQRMGVWAKVAGMESVHLTLTGKNLWGESASQRCGWTVGMEGREIYSSFNSHWRGEGGGEGRSRGACCCRAHQSRRIIFAKNKKMVFSSISNEFLWVSFYRIVLEDRMDLWNMQESSTELYNMLIYSNAFGFICKMQCLLCRKNTSAYSLAFKNRAPYNTPLNQNPPKYQVEYFAPMPAIS